MTGIMMRAVWLHHFQFGTKNFRHLIFFAHDTISVSSSLAVSDKWCPHFTGWNSTGSTDTLMRWVAWRSF